jgi:serine/threonine protein kinase
MSELPATGDPQEPAIGPEQNLPTLPGYEIIEELGRGGMGVVYKARQLANERMVALKLIRDGALAGPQERARFQTEREAIARVRHPNVVQIYETGEHRGRPYLAMEFVEGGSLAKYLAGQPQPATQAAQLVRTLALAVHHAHTQQIVHRDLKPANILIKAEGGGQRAESQDARLEVNGHADSQTLALRHPLTALRPLITDFGLAKRLDKESTAWTQDGAVLGTASYMSPEQAAGRIRDIGPAVDVYALGAILYELLTGRPPFHAATINQTIEQVLTDEPVPPTRLQGSVPDDLETVCLKCLEKEPGRRYPSAGDLAGDLERFLDGTRITAVPLSSRERLIRLAARDGYQVVDEIGRGPQSTVYRALYGALKQPVALKVYSAGICSQEDWQSRVRCSAQLTGDALTRDSPAPALAHPHIVPVHQAGWWDGAPYIAVEYVPHGCLATRLASVSFPIRDVLRLVDELTEIISYLHRQGIVHGNLKPSNVLLAGDGIPRIVDFRQTGGLFLGPLPANLTGPAVASVGYLAPELLDGFPDGEPRPYTDVYGLGTILYESLTGRPPFAATTVREIMELVRSQVPVPPSQFNSQITSQLDELCLRCLKKNPWRRHRRAFDVSTGLRYCLDKR